MGQRRLAIRNRRAGVGLLAVAAIGTALLAPLATSSTPVGAATIDGARSLADRVAVQFKTSKTRTTDVHLLAWNDFHGNLEAGAGLNIYGQFAGGAAWLAKAVHDKQAQYGDKQISVIAGDNIGASPLVDGLFFGEPSTIVTNLMNADFASVGNHEFDKGSDRAPPHPERRLPNRRRLHSSALRVGRWRHHQHVPRRRLPVPVGQRRAQRQRADAVPGLRHEADQERQRQEVRRSASSVRCSRQRPPSSPPRAWPGSPSRTRPTPPTVRWRSSGAWA